MSNHTQRIGLADDINEAIQQAVNGLRQPGTRGPKSVTGSASTRQPHSNTEGIAQDWRYGGHAAVLIHTRDAQTN
jgi:hypothetical protein